MGSSGSPEEKAFFPVKTSVWKLPRLRKMVSCILEIEATFQSGNVCFDILKYYLRMLLSKKILFFITFI